MPSVAATAQQKAYVTYSLSLLSPQNQPTPKIILHEAPSLPTNFYLNGLQDSAIEARELKWGRAFTSGGHLEWNPLRNIDLILGADLTYDPRNIPPLVSTFADIFELYPSAKILISATVRSLETFEKFPNACQMSSFGFQEIGFEMLKGELQEGPFYSDQAPVRLFFITKTLNPGAAA
ncbi:putative Protein FAM86A [Diplocarpon rosae]|nr:putative Protein FAM86A [Diplocarpon rosae]